MSKKVTVVVDAMGGDNAPKEIVKGAVLALGKRDYLNIILTGKETAIKEALDGLQYDKSRLSIVNATEEIIFNESPVAAIKKKKDSSLVVGLNLVKEGKADAIVSAGSSGAILAGGLFIVGRSEGVLRAPLACLIPTQRGVSMLIDCGANVDAKPEWLIQFAHMGSIYMEHILGVHDPKVALVNIGVEEEKGNALTKEVYKQLKELKDINFVGNIESREIPAGEFDVVVCDAFTGNAILKLYEGTAKFLISEIKKGILSTFTGKIGGLLIKKNLKKMLKRFDATEYGGAPLLGLKGLVVKCHGNASEKEIRNAILQCVSFKAKDINGKINSYLSTVEEQ